MEVLPTARDPAVLELEDDAVVDIQVLAVSHPAVVMDADDAAQAVACDGALARRVPGSVLVEELRKRLHVGRVEGLVCAADDLNVFVQGVPPKQLLDNYKTIYHNLLGLAMPHECIIEISDRYNSVCPMDNDDRVD